MEFIFPRIQQDSDGSMFADFFVLYALMFYSYQSPCCCFLLNLKCVFTILFFIRVYTSTEYTFCSLCCSLHFISAQFAITAKKRKIVTLFMVFYSNNGYIKIHMKLRINKLYIKSKCIEVYEGFHTSV